MDTNHDEKVRQLRKAQGPILNTVFKRRVFLINRPFQFKFMMVTVCAIVLCTVVYYVANEIFFQSFFEKGQELNLPEDHGFYDLLRQQRNYMNSIFITSTVILTTFFSIAGIIFSHRIAGPLYRLARFFESATESGSLNGERLSFREDDYFQELPEAINNYIIKVEENNKGNEAYGEDFKKVGGLQ